jgi:peptidoglycan/xylan/chitin deacetylase (PgdA/CDA1 family)
MPYEVKRDFIGYGPNPPDLHWPGGAKLAVNFVMNYEEGSEPSFELGDGRTEAGLTEALGGSQVTSGRDLAAEGMFEYGSRVGVWRLLRLFADRGLPMTVFGCALALERNPEAAAAIRAAGHDVCSHGWRWVKHFELTEAEERDHIAKAVTGCALASSRLGNHVEAIRWIKELDQSLELPKEVADQLLRRRLVVVRDRLGRSPAPALRQRLRLPQRHQRRPPCRRRRPVLPTERLGPARRLRARGNLPLPQPRQPGRRRCAA